MRPITLVTSVLGLAFWAVLMLVLAYPHDWVTLTNAPVLLILVSSVYSLLLPLAVSLALSALAVLMFNYQMVPPVHTFHVDLHEHGILLITMMGVSWLVTYLLRRQKQIAAREHQQAQRTLQLMQWNLVGNVLAQRVSNPLDCEARAFEECTGMPPGMRRP